MAILNAEYTEAGFESQIGVNHFAHFYLFKLLLPKLLQQEHPSRVVAVSSLAHQYGNLDLNDLHFKNGREYKAWESYAQSKTANILFAKYVNDKYHDRQITAVSVHPGVIPTNLGRHLPPSDDVPYDKNRAQGASTSVWAVLAPEVLENGGAYLEDNAVAETSEEATDKDGHKRVALWELTEKQLEDALVALQV